MNENTRTAVLYDRQPMWLEAIEGVSRARTSRVEGKAPDIETAIALIADQKPDLFVTDAEGDKTGAMVDFDHLRAAQAEAPGIKCIVLASANDRQTIEAAFSAGAFAYVLEERSPGRPRLSCAPSLQSVDLCRTNDPRRPREDARRWDDNTTTQHHGLGLDKARTPDPLLVAEGHSNAQLAAMLWVTEQTVKFHLSNVYRKIDVANRTEAARWAQLHGLLTGHRFDADLGLSPRPPRPKAGLAVRPPKGCAVSTRTSNAGRPGVAGQASQHDNPMVQKLAILCAAIVIAGDRVRVDLARISTTR